MTRESSSEVTVVWPKGYGFRTADDAVVITDATGGVVGTAGAEISIPGGEVEDLLDGLGFTAEDRALAEARCPGSYWIVAGSGSGS